MGYSSWASWPWTSWLSFWACWGRLPDAWVGHLTTMNTVALASVAGVYGANSVVGAWRSVDEKVKHLLRTPGKGGMPDFPDE